jgi:ketosteroid isomerase-like protein
MDQGDREAVHQVIDAFNSGDVDGALPYLASEVEWRGQDQRFGGHEGMRRLVASWGEDLSEHRLEVKRLVDMGDTAVAIVRERFVAKGEGDRAEETLDYRWTVRDGQVEQVQRTPPDNAEIVRRVVDALNRGDAEEALRNFDRRVEWLAAPQQSGDYKGHRGIRKLVSALRKDGHSLEVEKLIDVADETVMLVSDPEPIGYVWLVRVGKVERVQGYSSWEEALDVVGLSEQDF